MATPSIKTYSNAALYLDALEREYRLSQPARVKRANRPVPSVQGLTVTLDTQGGDGQDPDRRSFQQILDSVA